MGIDVVMRVTKNGRFDVVAVIPALVDRAFKHRNGRSFSGKSGTHELSWSSMRKGIEHLNGVVVVRAVGERTPDVVMLMLRAAIEDVDASMLVRAQGNRAV